MDSVVCGDHLMPPKVGPDVTRSPLRRNGLVGVRQATGGARAAALADAGATWSQLSAATAVLPSANSRTVSSAWIAESRSLFAPPGAAPPVPPVANGDGWVSSGAGGPRRCVGSSVAPCGCAIGCPASAAAVCGDATTPTEPTGVHACAGAVATSGVVSTTDGAAIVPMPSLASVSRTATALNAVPWSAEAAGCWVASGAVAAGAGSATGDGAKSGDGVGSSADGSVCVSGCLGAGDLPSLGAGSAGAGSVGAGSTGAGSAGAGSAGGAGSVGAGAGAGAGSTGAGSAGGGAGSVGGGGSMGAGSVGGGGSV